MTACLWITKKIVFILLGIRLKHSHNLCYRFTKKNQLIRVMSRCMLYKKILINVILSGIRLLHWLHYMFLRPQEETFLKINSFMNQTTLVIQYWFTKKNRHKNASSRNVKWNMHPDPLMDRLECKRAFTNI